MMHRPMRHGNQPNYTLQIGDGDHIALKTGIITLSDFRQKHVAAGGEGAPLAMYGDYFLFSKKGENRILLNISIPDDDAIARCSTGHLTELACLSFSH